MRNDGKRGPYNPWGPRNSRSETARIRIEAGLTQEQCALACGVSRRTLCTWEKEGAMAAYVKRKLAGQAKSAGTR
jgi:DNA-binding XRE family transcriptional regulator